MSDAHSGMLWNFPSNVAMMHTALIPRPSQQVKQANWSVRIGFRKERFRIAEYPKASFDVITMFDVFEHLQDPFADMKKLEALLKPDGIIIIATGDTQSTAAKVLKRRWTFLFRRSYILFHRKNVTTLLRQAGLKPIKWYRVGKWLSLGYVLHLARTTGESPIASWI